MFLFLAPLVLSLCRLIALIYSISSFFRSLLFSSDLWVFYFFIFLESSALLALIFMIEIKSLNLWFSFYWFLSYLNQTMLMFQIINDYFSNLIIIYWINIPNINTRYKLLQRISKKQPSLLKCQDIKRKSLLRLKRWMDIQT